MTTATATEDDLEDLSDEQLVTEALVADTDRQREEAFRELRSRYDFRGLFVEKFGCRQPTAEDLEQAVWSRVWRHLHRYDGKKFGTSFSTWLNTIAGNLGKNALRNRSRSPLHHNSDVELQVGGEDGDFDLLAQTRPEDLGPENLTQTPLPDPERSMRFRQLADALETAVKELDEPYRSTLSFWIRGLDYSDIARETDTRLGTVKSRMSRSRERCADNLRDLGYNPDKLLNESRG